MTTPVQVAAATGVSAAPSSASGTRASAAPMTPERWRAVDAILKAALAWELAERDAFVADACGDDGELRDEVASLLALHDSTDDAFLERPAAESVGVSGPRTALTDRLATTLAGRYAIERELAYGGMATVYLGRDLKHDRRVAIKVLREELAAAVGPERFLEEIRVTAALQHPHILPLFDSGADDGLLWYVMPFVDGETLRSRLTREGRLPAEVAVQLAREMADALEHAHRHGVVHRDVKPENVLLHGDPNGSGTSPAGGAHALVADFGIALAIEQAGGERLTRTGITLGTPQYMAPEQAAGERTIDARADVYALGAVLHEMLTGESPLAASQAAVPWRATSERATALAAPRPVVAASLDAAVRRALAKRPDDRYQSAAAFAEAIAAPLAGAERESESLGVAVPYDIRHEPAESARAGASRGRTVSARGAVYASVLMLVLGLVGGWMLSRSSLVQRWTSIAPGSWSPGPAADAAPWPATSGDMGLTLALVDRAGRPLRTIPANRPWTPRFSPDGRRLAYGAFGDGRGTSDLWVMDLRTGTTQRLTDDDGDSNDPQWSPDGSSLAYSVNAPSGKDLLVQRLGGGGPSVLAKRPGTQFASDWLRDGSALIVTDEAGRNKYDILVQPMDGSTAQPYVATSADETAARVSPNGRWIAYTSDESGRAEVYLDAYPRPGRRVTVSSGGGVHPVWRADGRELYYWNDGALVAVRLGTADGGAPPAVGEGTVLFRAPYHVAANTMYDVSPDGERFVIVRDERNDSVNRD